MKGKIENTNTFQFNTGVNIKNHPNNIEGGVDSGNGTIVISFEADVPKNAKLVFLSDYKGLNDGGKLIMREVKNTTIISKYAYFKI